MAAWAIRVLFGQNCFRTIISTVDTAMPATRAMIQPISGLMAKNTKIPPCGARDPTPNTMERAPVTAPPAMVAGITRSGSDAANGMAPSEINDSPNSQADLPFSCSAS